MILTTEEKLKHFEESSIAKATSLASDMVGEHQKALDKIFSDHKQGKGDRKYPACKQYGAVKRAAEAETPFDPASK